MSGHGVEKIAKIRQRINNCKRQWIIRNIQPDAIQALCSLATIVDDLALVLKEHIEQVQERSDKAREVLEQVEKVPEKRIGEYHAGSGV